MRENHREQHEQWGDGKRLGSVLLCPHLETWMSLFGFWAFLFFFFFLAAPQLMEFPGQGSDPSHSFNLCYRCSNTRSFNTLCQARDRWCCTDIAELIVPQWEVLAQDFIL